MVPGQLAVDTAWKSFKESFREKSGSELEKCLNDLLNIFSKLSNQLSFWHAESQVFPMVFNGFCVGRGNVSFPLVLSMFLTPEFRF